MRSAAYAVTPAPASFSTTTGKGVSSKLSLMHSATVSLFMTLLLAWLMSFAIVHRCDHPAQTAMNCADIGPCQSPGELRVAAGRGFTELDQRGLAALGEHVMRRAAM